MAVDDDKSLNDQDLTDSENTDVHEDEHVVPPGADDEIQRAQTWVKDDDTPSREQEQKEAGGFR